MTDVDREKWDAKYEATLGSKVPSELLREFAHLAPTGRALDIACGNGRNSLFLAQQGFTVDAVDISTVATGHLANRDFNIHVLCQDLDHWTIPPQQYELIVNIRFLDRRLFPMIIDGLKPGGVLVFQSFVDEQRETYCLRPNELLQWFRALRIVYYREEKAAESEKFDQLVSMVAVKAPEAIAL